MKKQNERKEKEQKKPLNEAVLLESVTENIEPIEPPPPFVEEPLTDEESESFSAKTETEPEILETGKSDEPFFEDEDPGEKKENGPGTGNTESAPEVFSVRAPLVVFLEKNGIELVEDISISYKDYDFSIKKDKFPTSFDVKAFFEKNGFIVKYVYSYSTRYSITIGKKSPFFGNVEDEDDAVDESPAYSPVIGPTLPDKSFDFPFSITGRAISLQDKYMMLKDFLSGKNIVPLMDIAIIGFGDVDFEFIFEKDGQFASASTIDVREYFIDAGFSVCAVDTRDYTRKGALRAVPEKGLAGRIFSRYFRDGKSFFIVRVGADSPYFSKNIEDDNEDNENEEMYFPSEDEKDGKKGLRRFFKKYSLFNEKGLVFLFLTLLVFMLFCFGLSSPAGGKKTVSEAQDVSFDAENWPLPRPDKIEQELEPELVPPDYYDIVFETSDGTKRFFRADYHRGLLKYHVTSYDQYGKAWRWDDFPAWKVRSITKLRAPFGLLEPDFDEKDDAAENKKPFGFPGIRLGEEHKKLSEKRPEKP